MVLVHVDKEFISMTVVLTATTAVLTSRSRAAEPEFGETTNGTEPFLVDSLG